MSCEGHVKVRSGQVILGQVRSGKFRSVQGQFNIRSGQIKIRSGQDRVGADKVR